MCLACEMDQMWMLYLEQQAQAAKKADGGSAPPMPEADNSAATLKRSSPPQTLICEEPMGE